jgi:hypothetical protein
MRRKVLIMGLPGAGKTTLATILARRLGAVHFDADQVRQHVNKDLSFSETDRIEHARRMGWLCDQVVKTGAFALADFVCPTQRSRSAFAAGGEPIIVWVDRIAMSRFPDTNKLFERPERFDVRVLPTGSAEYWAEKIALMVRPVFDARRPTALIIGRFQPFHTGHRLLAEEGIRRCGQVCIAVRETGGQDEDNPFSFEEVRARIELALRDLDGQFTVLRLPNTTDVLYGRDVGYRIERVSLGREVESISATELRAVLRGAGAREPDLIEVG